MKKILVTGAFGQIGSELVPALQEKFGKDNVVAMGHEKIDESYDGILEKADSRDKNSLETIIKNHDIGTVYHLVSLLSVKGETDPSLTWDINMNGLKTILDLGVRFDLKIFWPSSIAAFGPSTPRDNTPQHTVLEPTTIYGVTKYAGEGLCRYYNIKYGLDVRSVRYPGILSWKTPPGRGTTEYAIEIFYEGLQKGRYTCFLREDTKLPMMYVDDAIRATIVIMEAPLENIKVRNSYNIAALSFTAGELASEVKKYIPNLEVDYKPDKRQLIADSWPRTIDDSEAKKDWGWTYEYDLPKMTKVMVENLRREFGIPA
ncbi:MAG: L-threonine 3-dehydrogenase [Candidatus Woesebacteria bacterium GW2011_GWB1_38_5b]|uniref:L-threonine 3-dehydrogenase n=1 Tax=Candidatus Woesebacteria bacterium GW2011_GWB1_38_5b TaxID=1618569 RepID=A0A0G0MM68_9BACT|nr:MAG: L-threonine 3-dehydrogenase [Candidatus Woesebacteria bacterium GW2011_GWB1_38_5b]OGH47205.1 MAG: NAD-dependent epimerase [Candidatus Levybacteria bacterium RIFCSPLOWO2_01_FULL_39_10]